MKCFLSILAFLILTISGTFSYAQSDSSSLSPQQVLIIANSSEKDSMNLARFYANERKISPRNILFLDLPTQELISQDQYENKIAKPIRSFLRQQKLENKIRVLVTMYGVPLKIAQATPTARQRTAAQNLQTRYRAAYLHLQEQINKLEKMAGIGETSPASQPGVLSIESFKTQLPILAQKIEGYYRIVVPEIQALKDPVDRDTRANDFGQIRLAIEGQSAFVGALKAQSPIDGQKLEDQLKQMDKELQALLQISPEDRDLDKTYALARTFGGLILELKTLYEDFGLLNQKESASAVDSELCLVLWNAYPKAGRLPNPLNPRLTAHPAIANRKEPVLMVSRLDGPTPAGVERMIRDSITAETKGLTGKFYIDARGITDQNGFFVYDQNLRDLAKLVENSTKIPVVLDNKPELFQPAASPDTALYCGWYSLRNYIPAFTFVPGSVGYHIASFEATTLKTPKNNQWVQRMIENGIAATLGAVNEPYLDSFPLPEEFFGLLLTGQYSLADVFYKTNRYLSWQIILIGDPLYKPFAANPQLKEDQVKYESLPLLLLN
jgi:uncharacterized protein (TIGR03790 family)